MTASSVTKCSSMTNSRQLPEEREEWLRVFRYYYSENVTPEEVKELKPSFVLKIYFQFVKMTLRASLDNMKAIMIQCSSEHMVQYPELYEKFIMFPRVTKLLKWFFSRYANDDSFTIEDLMNSTPKRTRNFFNYIVDYTHEHGELLAQMEDISEQAGVQQQRVLAVRAEAEEWRARTAELQKRKVERRIQAEEVTKQVCVLSEELDAQHAVKADQQAKLEVLRRHLSTKKQENTKTQLHCVELKEVVAELGAQVVEEEERQQLQETEHKLQTYRQENDTKLSQLGMVEELLARTRQKLTLLSDALLPLLHDTRAQQDQVKVIEEEDGSLQRDMKERASQGEDADHQLSVAIQRLSCLQDHRTQLSAAAATRMQGLEAELQAAAEMLHSKKNFEEEAAALDGSLGAQLEKAVQRRAAAETEAAALQHTFQLMREKLNDSIGQHNLKIQSASEALLRTTLAQQSSKQ